MPDRRGTPGTPHDPFPTHQNNPRKQHGAAGLAGLFSNRRRLAWAAFIVADAGSFSPHPVLAPLSRERDIATTDNKRAVAGGLMSCGST